MLSRQLYVEPVRSKRSGDMIVAFEAVFSRCGYMPWRLMTDSGREFTAREVQAFFKRRQVQHHCMHTSPLWHAGMAERANRSIKERLYRYFTHRGTQSWVGVIQRIVHALNSTPNSAIFGLRPRDITFANAEGLRQKLEKKLVETIGVKRRLKAKFRLGDEVRVERRKHVFRKGYLPTFSNEVFHVTRVRTQPKQPCTYRLADSNGQLLPGWFYAQEMCRVHDTDRYQGQEESGANGRNNSVQDRVYEIESILERRRRKGMDYCLVKWKGYSEKENSWIPATSII